MFAITFQQLRWNPPEFQKIEVQAPFLINPLRDAVIDPNGRAAIFDVPRNLKAPYSHQYNFSWELPVHGKWRVQLGYVGSRTHKLLMLWHLNRARQVPGVPLSGLELAEATVLVSLGDLDGALAVLERRVGVAFWLGEDEDGHATPALAPLWSDPRFRALIRPRD